jgi:hypothetical protein
MDSATLIAQEFARSIRSGLYPALGWRQVHGESAIGDAISFTQSLGICSPGING